MFYELEPEVPGGLGRNAVLDTSVHPPRVIRFHLELFGWLGDQLLETFPCYVVTRRLQTEIQRIEATGCEFDDVEVTLSGQFTELYPNRSIPSFSWMKINGVAGIDDLGISDENLLVVSERVLTTFKQNKAIDYCDIKPVTAFGPAT